jgi:uncharacterized membrane protein
MRLTQKFFSWVGWCPIKNVSGNKCDKSPQSPDEMMSGRNGPVEGRAVLFLYLTWMMVGLSYLVALYSLSFLPEQIPVHWNLFGEPDRFEGKIVGAFGLPAIITLTTLFLTILPRFEKIQSGLKKARDIYQIIIFTVITLLFAMEVIVLLVAGGMEIPIDIVIPMLFGLLFIVLGSLMPYIGRNTMIGFRLPWTLNDDEIWRKTHEQGGPAFVMAGAMIVLFSPMVGIWSILLMLIILVAVSLWVTYYSYRLSRSKAI